MVSDMLTDSGEWDWRRLENQLLNSVLESLAAVKPLKAQYGADVPGWRWEERRNFTPDMLYSFLAAPFDIWLLDNIQRSVRLDHPEFDWSMRFLIFCWLLWKHRCDILFDMNYSMHESILDRGNRLIIECNKAFSCTKSDQLWTGIRERFWKRPDRDWVKVNVDASVDTVDNKAAVGGIIRDNSRGWLEVGWWKLTMYRGRRIVADNLAALGQRYGKDGRVLMVPPGTVASIVAVEQRRWMEERLRDAEDSTAKDDGP
ncbi:hypothetical protein V6N11_082658 [Hibiscus sabdariffa]|uniref:Uncharacterized protein n=1 Tax=Hibiscus sabdariffa TaxID=183260 RepID=A0ABR2P9B8_9ROSI